MRIANVLAGFTLGEADVLRKAMGKKDPKVMAKQRGKFVDGAQGARASTRRRRRKIFDLMEHFAGYGFNKSHSTAYAFLAYQTAYLKANYPWHFAAALLTIEAQNTDKLALYLGECRERGIPVLPPDINESQLHFTVEPAGRALRPDRDQERRRGRDRLAARRCARQQGRITLAARALRRSRPAPGQQARVREPGQGRRLRFAGAGHGRRGAAVGGAAAAAARRRRRAPASTAPARSATAIRGRPSCSAAADEDGGGVGADPRCPTAPPWTEIEQLGYEKETLGLYLSGHPVDRYADDLRAFGATTDRRARRRAGRRPRGDALGPGRPQADRADTCVGGIVAGLPPAEDARRATAWRLHARGCAGRRRSRRLSGDVQRSAALIENGHAGAGARQVRARRRDRRASWRPRSLPLDSVRERLARGRAIRLNGAARPRTFEALGDLFVAPPRRSAGGRSRSRCTRQRQAVCGSRPTSRRRSACGRREHLVAEVEQICGAGSVTLR